jgi:putative SOS response-associated peptidase YedK
MYNLTSPPSNLQPRFNICPTTTADVVVGGGDQRALVPMRWGLIPGWWKKPLKEMRMATFNARAETVAEKPMFRDSFQKRRCLMPASGYYEWQDTPEGKQPFYFTRRDGQVMTIAAIQDEWRYVSSDDPVRSCSMLITESNKFVAEVHDRMPVILEAGDFEQWERGDIKDAAALMKAAGEDVLQKLPVSKRVNSSRTSDDDPLLIERADGVVDQEALAATMIAIARTIGNIE